jgi:YidC/Oxa1 family membrane protein insertase
VFNLLAGILSFFYDLIPNYAVAIALLTLTVMLVLTPITLKGTRSMLAMQKLQPEMKRLQDLHKGDRQAQNEALMAFYKEHKINPLAGCLPMVAQFPVLIVMFRVISGLVKTKMVNGVKVGNPAYLSHDSDLYKALVKSGGKMASFGIDFGAKPTEAGAGAIALYILIGLVVATGYWQVRQMQSRSSSSQQINPQAQMLTKVMPLFSGFISLSLPGGVTLYFLVSNLFRISQQSLMYRFDPHLKAHVAETREVKSRAVADPQPKPDAQPRKSLFGGLMSGMQSGGGDTTSNGNGANKPNASGTPKSYSNGRVTPPASRPKNKKRSKRKR